MIDPTTLTDEELRQKLQVYKSTSKSKRDTPKGPGSLNKWLTKRKQEGAEWKKQADINIEELRKDWLGAKPVLSKPVIAIRDAWDEAILKASERPQTTQQRMRLPRRQRLLYKAEAKKRNLNLTGDKQLTDLSKISVDENKSKASANLIAKVDTNDGIVGESQSRLNKVNSQFNLNPVGGSEDSSKEKTPKVIPKEPKLDDTQELDFDDPEKFEKMKTKSDGELKEWTTDEPVKSKRGANENFNDIPQMLPDGSVGHYQTDASGIVDPTMWDSWGF